MNSPAFLKRKIDVLKSDLEAADAEIATLTAAVEEGKAEWEGAVKGDDISGTFIWSKEGQDPIIYTYKGSIKK